VPAPVSCGGCSRYVVDRAKKVIADEESSSEDTEDESKVKIALAPAARSWPWARALFSSQPVSKRCLDFRVLGELCRV
jgi:hypothetical protein